VAALAAGRGARVAAGTGVGLGAAAVLKYPFSLTGAVALLAAGRARAAVVAGLVAAAGVAASIAAWGLGPWQAWLAALGPWSERPVHAVTALQMPRGLLARLFELHPEHSPSPILDAPAVGDALWLALAAVVAGVTALALWRARRSNAPLAAVGVIVPAALLVSPYVDDYTFVLTLMPLAVAARGLGLPKALGAYEETPATGPRLATAWLILGLAALLLGADIPFREADPAGLEALLWYPRVYGTAILWGLLVWLALRRPAAGAPGDAGRGAPAAARATAANPGRTAARSG
jgi:hypothetical protein